jgi:hypothetical protein
MMKEPTYVMTDIYQDKESCLQNYARKQQQEQQTIMNTFPQSNNGLLRPPETIFYEGTLIITSGKSSMIQIVILVCIGVEDGLFWYCFRSFPLQIFFYVKLIS